MKIQKSREIVIEFERVQLIRKCARTRFLHCQECQKETDAISLSEAASLFDVEMENLFQFIKTNDSHYQPAVCGEIFICLMSLLDCLKKKTGFPPIKMIGD